MTATYSSARVLLITISALCTVAFFASIIIAFWWAISAPPIPPWLPLLLTSLLWSMVLVAVRLLLPGLVGKAKKIEATRTHGGAAGQALGKSWFIESTDKTHSCSFVEFDGRGDFLDLRQHEDCLARIERFARSPELNLLVIIYCHGWNNNSQSNDVWRFNGFLGLLTEALSRGIRPGDPKPHVHGVYLAWQGSSHPPLVDKSNPDYISATARFPGAIVDAQFHATKNSLLDRMLPLLSYWDRKMAAEHKVSGLPIARAVFSYASAAKYTEPAKPNRAFVMGHSFGALLLEKSLGQACVGALTMQWARTSPGLDSTPSLPFDCVLLVNSAAPALHAKELRDFLAENRVRLISANHPRAQCPVFISLTSSSDTATRDHHALANIFAPWSSCMNRDYIRGLLGDGRQEHSLIKQGTLYSATPGHHQLLINRWVRKFSGRTTVPTSKDIHVATVQANLQRSGLQPNVFLTSDPSPMGTYTAWELSEEPKFNFDGLSPAMAQSGYWIIQCGSELIKDHGDIWSKTAMEVYSALFGFAK